MKFLPKIAIILALMVSVPAGAIDLPTDHDDEFVERALRAALLGDAEEVHLQARLRRREEDTLREAHRNFEELAENIESLALATRRPLPTLRELNADLSDLPRDRQTKNMDRQLRIISPRQRFIEASKDVRYVQVRRFWNSLSQPIFSAVQGQFFPLISLPFHAVDYMVVGRKYLTPEQRKKLYLARDVRAEDTRGRILNNALDALDEGTPRRLKLAALQAELNARSARQDGRLDSSLFWYERELELRDLTEPFRDGHLDLLKRVNRLRVDRERSLSVADGDKLLLSTDEFAAYTDLVRMFILDPGSIEFERQARRFQIDFSFSAAMDDVSAAAAASSFVGGNPILATVQLESLSEDERDEPWGQRAARYLDRPDFSSERAFEVAESKIDRRFWEFIVLGEPPEFIERSYRPEDARMRRRSWVDRARAFFVTDIISRAMILPFLDPFPRNELMEAAATADPAYLATPEGEGWLRKTAKAQSIARRYQDAARTYTQIGDNDRAVAMERRAAKYLEQQGDRSGAPSEAADFYRRLLNAFPDYPNRERVEEKFQRAKELDSTVTYITKEELAAYPEMWFGDGLMLSPSLFNGNQLDGEISDAGVTLLDYGAFSYVDIDGGNRIEVPLPEDRFSELMRMLEPRRRARALYTELKKPLPRKRIPLAVEGGAFPGFSVGPTLVPLDPDERERQLYY